MASAARQCMHSAHVASAVTHRSNRERERDPDTHRSHVHMAAAGGRRGKLGHPSRYTPYIAIRLLKDIIIYRYTRVQIEATIQGGVVPMSPTNSCGLVAPSVVCGIERLQCTGYGTSTPGLFVHAYRYGFRRFTIGVCGAVR